MDIKQIEELMRLMQAQGFNECEWEHSGTRIKLVHKAASSSAQPLASYPFLPSSAPSFQQPVFSGSPSLAADYSASETPSVKAPSSKASKNRKEIRSPFVGTFYESAAPGQPSFVTKGAKVSKGDTLCIVEAMKLMNELESDYDGVITEILVQNEEPVEFDQLLFVVE